MSLYDLEDRALKYARDVRSYIDDLPKEIANFEYSKQLIRSSSSIGTNYIEANEGLGKKDFVMRAKIARKEAKESRYWLQLCKPSVINEDKQKILIKESTDLIKILSAIINKVNT